MNPDEHQPLDLKERGIYDAFLVAVAIKGFDGVLEAVLGALFMFTNVINSVVLALISNELIDDPDNFFATHLRAFATQSHHAQLFGGLYLVAHGTVKAVLSFGLWRNYAWAYPAAIAFLGLFLLYQLIHVAQTGSIPLSILTIFDLAMLWLVWHEYMRFPQKD